MATTLMLRNTWTKASFQQRNIYVEEITKLRSTLTHL